jgi:hypothetical protein
MANKTFTSVWRPTAFILPPVLATGLCVIVDDRHGQFFDQPHDHREDVPAESSPRVVTIDSGSSTATATSFSHHFFNDLIVGDVSWPVQNRPDLLIRVEKSVK